MAKYLLSALLSAGLVAGHGYVTNATIGGQSYTFYQPYTDPYTSPTPQRVSRKIPGNGPVENVTSIDIQCNGDSADGVIGSEPAALHAAATAGSDVTLYWTLWPDSHYGAFTTYMARCPDTGCQDFLPNSTAVWFKIAEAGLTSANGTNAAEDTWAVDAIEVAGNAGYTYTIPSCLADGYYLVRHEIIAVFLAGSYPGAQLYPGCHQLNVTGGGSTTVEDLVAFPGAYEGTDPGITWDSSSTTYPIPGPSVFSCASGEDASSATAATATASSSVEAVSATTLSTAIASSVSAAQTSVTATASVVAVAAESATGASASAPSAVSTAASSKTCSKKKRSNGERHGSQ